jgi:beta-galactosidase/beta-glucuronidase
LFYFLSARSPQEDKAMQELFTKEAARIPAVPWEAYPRPQMRRERWLCLNGRWELSFDDTVQSVRVPFCVESLLSKLGQKPETGEKLHYRRCFSLPEEWRGLRILLHFGAVMRRASVRVNGKEVAESESGFLPFSADITDALREGENELCVAVVNDLDSRYPYGKQSRKRGGMWYTPCSGIWQTVWLEPVPEQHIRSLQINNGADWVEIKAEGVRSGAVVFDGQEYKLLNGTARIEIRDPHMWSPDDPFLYPFSLVSGEDSVASYFALRTLSTETVNGVPRLCLNGKPFFFNGLLDQGYWSDGLYTPATPEGFERDILAMKSLGFNTLRKHIKIEPERFYYDCDRLGMIVFQDMVNNGEYRYVRDTVLPTLHFQKRRDKRLNRDREANRIFLESMRATVRHLQNHPCICLWTIFNEGWGQFCADEAYERLKAMDPSRFIDSTSGWFHQKKSDVDSLHIYFDKLRLGKEERPQLLSEFGGYVWKVPEHSYNLEKTYGYHKYDTKGDYILALRALYTSLIPLAQNGLCGAIYTQVSDVEDETNGFFTFDRAVLKIEAEALRDLAEKLSDCIHDR